jgi:hypothetical protein
MTRRANLILDSLPWFLAIAGMLGGLMIPLSASADHRSNGAAEVLVSAAVAYAVIDAAGGFKDDRHGHRPVHYRHDHRYHYRHDYHYRHGYHYRSKYDRRYWTRHGHRHDRYEHRKHRKHGRDHDRRRSHDRTRGDRHRLHAYH